MTEALIFFGDSAAGNHTIWRSDGTPAGTAPIFDVDLGGTNNELLDYGNTILAGGANSGKTVLWFYNKSTSAYTYYDYSSAIQSFSPSGFVEYKGLVYFSGNVGNGGDIAGFPEVVPSDLFATDGTVEGTIRITTSYLFPYYLAVAYNKLFFSGRTNGGPIAVLYSYDGGGALPVPIAVDVLYPRSLAAAFVGTVYMLPDPDLPFASGPYPPLFMNGGEWTTGSWLYQYDGSSLTSIVPWTASSPNLFSGLSPSNLVNLGWVQTSKLGPYNLEAFHRALCFAGTSASGAQEVWISLGTTQTTTMIPMPSVPGLTSHSPNNLTPFNGMLYFAAYDSAPPNGRGLFVYDPVANETRQIIKSSAYDLNPGQGIMAVFNNNLYFNAKEPAGKPSLWRIDGAPTSGQATPQLVSSGGNNGLNPISLTTANF